MKLPPVYENLTDTLGDRFYHEVQRLMDSGAIDESTGHCTIIRVAIENIADGWSKGDTKTYNNLKKF